MASKNMRSEGYTQFPVLASSPVSCSVLAGRQAGSEVEERGLEDRGMVEISRDVLREGWLGGREGWDWDDVEGEEEKKGRRGR